MNKKIISYSLFHPKKLYEHRVWDDDKFDKNRYFFNIPALCSINKFLYPEYKMHLTVCPETEKNYFFSFYQQICDQDDFFSYSVNNDAYQAHEPALWRISHLWDDDLDILLSRDIDSIPNLGEYISVRYFESSKYSVHTIRSHANHYQFPCRMLIGLSAFKKKQIPANILKESFEKFQEAYTPKSKWDGDQISLINAFTTNDFFTSDNFLDSMIDDQFNYQDFFCYTMSRDDFESVEIDENRRLFFDMIKSLGLSSWAGQPCDARNENLNSILSLTGHSAISKILEKDIKLKNFYLTP
jgi:hypothetical protein